MAKVLKNGLLSGRVGNLVYFVINGKQYVRAWVKPSNPRTPLQKRHRAKMMTCGKFFGPLKSVILIGYQGTTGDLEEYNESTKYHLATALEETTPPDSEDYSFRVIPEKVKLSRGDIQKPEIFSCTRTGNELTLTWNSELGRVSNRLTDTIALVACIPGKSVFTDFHVGTRKEGTGTLILPKEFKVPALIWVFYWNGQKGAEPDRRNVSDSVYIGVL